jgi:uncharacterized protein YegP (UPF0339 family)
VTFTILQSEAGYYLTIVARNGQMLGRTTEYTTKRAARHAAYVLIQEATYASVVDATGSDPWIDEDEPAPPSLVESR